MTSTSDKSRNLSEAHRFVLEAVERGTDLLAFPENFSLFTDDGDQFSEEAETLRGLTLSTLQEWAAEHDLWILAGSLPIRGASRQDRRVTNSSFLISDEGEIIARYDKIHLFDAKVQGDRSYQESKHVRPGKAPVAAETPFGNLGLSICYDLRFPELYRALAQHEVRVIFIPSAFTEKTGKAHWDVLTRARAIENQAFVVAPAQTASPFPNRVTHGHTRIVDPWGRLLAERPGGAGLVWANLDFKQQDQLRAEMPVLKHRRLK
jgi:deaminated glutathione amidase